MSAPPVDETQFVPDGTGPRVIVADTSGTDRRFGRFRADALLGTGATGSVYRAHDAVLGRPVAIKALHPNCELAVRARFVNEARAIGSVLHPNIVAVFDAGTVDAPAPYFVMELASGSLRDAMHAHRLDVEAVRRAGIQIARALAAAHAANILHRDVKPANILDVGGAWKLADFGIARLPDSTLTDTGQFLGSPSYAAPESLRAGQFTPASDIYALAATLYEALAGAPPHGDHDMPSVVRKLEHDPPPLHLRCPVPRAMADTIMAALARDPAARPTAAAFADQLATTGAPSLVTTPAPAPSRRIVWVALGAAVVAVALLALALVQRFQEPSAPTPAVFASPRVDRPATRAPVKPAPPPPAAAPSPIAPIAPDASVPSPIDPYAAPSELAAPIEPPPPATPDEATASTQFFDEHGNLFDDDTAKQMLRDLERDARTEMNRYRNKRWRRSN